MKIRIKFKKYGAMKFIGHLDVMRYFQKAIRRADVEICYSGGFSPHQIMSFAAPLGVGITSNGEYADIEVADTEDAHTMAERLNRVMSEGFEIISCCRLPDAAANAMSIVEAADYSITFRPGYEPENIGVKQWFEGLISYYGQPSVVVTKKTKRGERQMDLKPLIYELKLCHGAEEGTVSLFMKISTGSTDNVKPEQILDAYYNFMELERPPFAFEVQREEVYADEASDAHKEAGRHCFVSLEQLGEDIS